MPTYDERFAQEAQEEEYLKMKHFDDDYWYSVFSEDLRIKEPPFVAIGYNQQTEPVLVRARTKEELELLCKKHELTAVSVYEPKHFI